MAPRGTAHDAIGRREFLKAAGAATLISPLVARHVRGANDRVNLAFIGLGRRGSANFGHAARVPGFHVAAICDPHPPALKRAQVQVKALGLTGTKAHRDLGEILADGSIDAVCIAVPPALASHLTVRACQSGKDVYVETPLFVRLDEGPPIVDAARQCHRVVQAGTILRSGIPFQKAREVVRSGKLGGVAFCRITGANDPMPLIDLVQFLFDEAAPVSLDAQVGVGPVNITFRYPAFIASYRSRPGPWGVSIHGTEATLVVSRAGYSLFPGDRGRPASEQRGDLGGDLGGGEDGLQIWHWKNFLECIRTGRRPAGDIEACVRSTTACLRAGLAMPPTWTSG